jgi:hypothetical protein
MVFIKNVKFILLLQSTLFLVQGKTFDLRQQSSNRNKENCNNKGYFWFQLNHFPLHFYQRQKGGQKPNDQLTKTGVY